jgi:hypothetical protein
MLTGPCAVTVCQRQSTLWKRVTEYVIAKGQTNNTLPSYVQVGDTICLNCYNGIVVKCSPELQQNAQASMKRRKLDDDKTDEAEDSDIGLSFSEAIGIITDILYNRENRERKSTLYSFDEFRAVISHGICHAC